MSVSQSPQNPSASPQGPAAGFGPNEWLVDELYQQYQQDKESVDPAWWEFFADFTPEDDKRAALKSAPDAEKAGRETVAPSTEAPPDASRDQPPASSAGSREETAADAKSSVPAPSAPTTARTTVPEKTGTPAVTPGGSGGTARSSPAKPAEPAPKLKPAKDEKPADDKPVGPEEVRIKGAAARVVTNMEASLTVPTATSVRAVPAKLLVDNRIVINSNLARARGGKVSFTHLIGFAVVEALAHMPEMNHGYTEVDGKPALLKNRSVNLGIAIDLPKDDGTRQLLVPSIKNADRMDFAQFWAAYEDVIRRARGGKLTVEDFQGTTISLTNPGTIGTVHSVPRLMQGQGTIIGVGRHGLPGRVRRAPATRPSPGSRSAR